MNIVLTFALGLPLDWVSILVSLLTSLCEEEMSRRGLNFIHSLRSATCSVHWQGTQM